MTIPKTQSQRFHSLDNLRALMMWLGIVLHVSGNHLVGKHPMPFVDGATSVYANLTLVFIHAFRMPVFFILAGFFCAILIRGRGVSGMLKHRLRRIALPFVILGPPIFAVVGLLALIYVHVMVTGTFGVDFGLLKPDPNRPTINTMHLWFLYYLLLYSFITVFIDKLCKLLPDAAKGKISDFGNELGATWYGFIVLLVPLTLLGAFYRAGLIRTSGSFMPEWPAFAYDGLFFVFGFFLYWNRQTLLPLYARRCWRYTGAGLFLLVVFMALFKMNNLDFDHFAIERDYSDFSLKRIGIAAAYTSASLMWSFAFIGLSVRYFPHQNRFLRYISESSYWVYLVHMIGTIGFGIILYLTPLPALVKMGINVLATSLFSLASYQLLVRFTGVGMLLNGHRHVRRSPEVKAAVLSI